MTKEKINIWMISTIILIVAVVVLIGLQTTSMLTESEPTQYITAQEAADKALAYINDNLVQPGTKVSITSVEEVSGIYKIITSYQGQTIPIYVTKDGKYLILQQGMINMSQEIPKEETQQPEETETNWSLFQTSLPDELKNKILAFVYQEPVQIEDRVLEFKNYSECKGDVIVFYFEWCGWCKEYHSVLAEAKEDYPSITFYTLDLGENKDVGDKFGVTGTPATVINCKYLVSGYLPKESLYPILNKYMK